MQFHLTEIPGNAVPPLGKAGFFLSFDGLPIRYAVFSTIVRPFKGTVIILSGRNETIEKYFETISALQASGFAAAIMDLRGQGFSGRTGGDIHRGHVGSFDDYATDLDSFFDAVILADCTGPFFILGHSTGSLVALLAAPALINRVRRMVLMAPLLDFPTRSVPRGLFTFAMRLMKMIGFGKAYAQRRKFVPEPFATNVLTGDFRRYERNQALRGQAPELALSGPTFGWIDAAVRAIRKVSDPDFIARIHIPILFIAAGADTVVANSAIEDYARRLRSGALVTVDGSRHELLQEEDRYREQALAAFLAFVPGQSADY